MNNHILSVQDVSHFFLEEDGRKTDTLKNVSFDVRPGEFFTILGPSGCGKSTLLRILGGMIAPTRGTITFANPEHAKHMSMVFQSFALFPWLSVYHNVEFGLKMKGMPAKERDTLVREHIQEIGLEHFERSYPKDLSGGMRQRVGIARALAMSPEILLMDEPFSALDAFTAEKLRNEMLGIWMKDKMTTLMVTHLVDEAVEMADRVVVMTPRPGQVDTIIHIDLPRPRDKRSPEFFALVDKITSLVKI